MSSDGPPDQGTSNAHGRFGRDFVVKSALIAYFGGGFLFGVFMCDDCTGLVGNTIGRVFIGVVMALFSAATFGFPPEYESGDGRIYNVWPWILFVWVGILGWRYFIYRNTK